MLPLIDALLEGFSEELHPRGWHGRFRAGDKVRVKLKGGGSIVGRVVRPADAEPETHAIVQPENGGPHVIATLDSMTLDTPESSDREHQKKAAADLKAALGSSREFQPAKSERRRGRPRVRDVTAPRAAVRGRAFHPSLGVREAEMSDALGSLLEGFDEARHPRGFHGRWIRGRGGRPGRLEGTYNGVKLERGVAYQGELAGGKIFTGHWTGEVQGFGRDDVAAQEPIFRHVDDPSMRRTFSGGKFYGRLSDVKPASPALGATSERHGSFKIGDRVKYETGSRGPGGHGPVTFTTQPGVHEVVGFQRNGNLRIKHPDTGTTVDVHHSHATKVGPLHPEYRGEMVQQDYAREREKIAREKAARAGGGSAVTTRRRATLGQAEGDAAARERAEILRKSPSAAAELAQHRSVMAGARQAADVKVLIRRTVDQGRRGEWVNVGNGRAFQWNGANRFRVRDGAEERDAFGSTTVVQSMLDGLGAAREQGAKIAAAEVVRGLDRARNPRGGRVRESERPGLLGALLDA